MRIDQIELTGSLSISASLATNPLVVNDDYLFVSNTGNVGIGTNNPTKKLVVTGSIAVQGQLKATTLSGSFTGSVKLSTIPLGTSETNIVLVNGGGNLVYRDNLSLTGAQGNQGPTGFQGAAGVAGAQGTTGAQGFQGRQGPQGSQGPQGAQGPQGRQGPSGIISGVTKILFGSAELPGDGSAVSVTFPSAFSSTPIVTVSVYSYGYYTPPTVFFTSPPTTTGFSCSAGQYGTLYWIAIN